MNVVLAARSRGELDALAAELRALGIRAMVVPTDAGRRADLEALAAAAEREAGGADVLVNNAGIEVPCEFHRLPLGDMDRMLGVNLIGALTLTRLVLPAMVARGRGHIVNIASMAGKSGPPLAEIYATTKAGLIAFTHSLRVSYHGTGVSASAICPGFIVGEGMFADRSRRDGVQPPRALGAARPEQVAEAVVRALQRDLPEILVTPGPARLMQGVAQLFPRLPGWFMRRTALRELYRKSAPAGRAD
jgi:short-subunit dehydrogenase